MNCENIKNSMAIHLKGKHRHPDFEYDFPAGSFDYPTSAPFDQPAPLDTDTGGNGQIKRQLMDDTTEEFVMRQFKLHSQFTERQSQTVMFAVVGYSVTAAGGSNVRFNFRHSARNNVRGLDERNWDFPFASVESPDFECSSDQDYLDYFFWTETVENLEWVARDDIRIMLSRIATDDSGNLTGDYGLVDFKIIVPLQRMN